MTATANTTTAANANNIMTTNTNALRAAAAATTPVLDENKELATDKAVCTTRYHISSTIQSGFPLRLPETRKSKTNTATQSDDAVDTATSSSDLEGEESDAGDDSAIPHVPFVPTQCLFCNMLSATLDANLAHMHKRHGLFLPLSIDDGARALAVDLETLVRYLHLVVFGYHECLLCRTRRQNPHAVQQHMMGRGHCRVDLDEGGDEEDGGSEYRDFYEDLDGDAGVSEDDGDDEGQESATAGEDPSSAARKTSFNADDNTLRLASGKTLLHRATNPPARPNRRPLAEPPKGHHGRRGADLLLEDLMPTNPAGPGAASTTTTTTTATSDADAGAADVPSPAPSAAPQTQTQALTRIERRALTHHSPALTAALTQMSARDRAALAHLSPAERRALVVRRFRQQEGEGRAERRYRGKVDVRFDRARHGLGAAWDIEVIKHDG